MFDYVEPGGVSADLPADAQRLLIDRYLAIEKSVFRLRGIYDDHAGLRDRFQEAAAWKKR